VRLSNGQTGYVHKAFLVPVERQEEGGPMVGADDVPVAKSDAPVAQGAEPAEIVPAEPAARAEAAPNNEENDQPRSGDEPSGKEPLERVVESLQAEVGRLLEVTGKIQGGSVGAEPTPTPVWGDIAAVDATESGSLLGVSIVSLVAGFALGAIYGRRQERGRRTRVRF
jgi:hypothetical protein